MKFIFWLRNKRYRMEIIMATIGHNLKFVSSKCLIIDSKILQKIELKLNHFPYLCLATLFILSFLSCASSSQSVNIEAVPTSVLPGEPREPKYLLQLGDIIEIKFFYYPEIDEKVIIRPDGMISLQLIGEIKAAGLAPSELNRILKERYAQYLARPEVVVIVKELAGERVYIGGEVMKPGEILMKGRLTLVQAVFQAGGLTDQAKSSNILILRSAGPNLKAFKVNLDEVLEKGVNDMLLKPYDIVYVPKTVIAKVDQFINQYINAIVPRSISFPFVYQLNRPGRGVVVIGGP